MSALSDEEMPSRLVKRAPVCVLGGSQRRELGYCVLPGPLRHCFPALLPSHGELVCLALPYPSAMMFLPRNQPSVNRVLCDPEPN